MEPLWGGSEVTVPASTCPALRGVFSKIRTLVGPGVAEAAIIAIYCLLPATLNQKKGDSMPSN
jgi:hypothetical protein